MESILHPLVLINVSDHLTRESCRAISGQHGLFQSQSDVVVLGALLGTLDGGHLALVNSFEIAFLSASEESTAPRWSRGLPDWDFFQQRLSQYHEVFPTLELVGWYVAGSDDFSPFMLQFLEESGRYCDSPYILSLKSPSAPQIDLSGSCAQSLIKESPKNTSPSNGKQSIQIQLFDKFSSTSLNLAECLREISFKLEAGEAERIVLSDVISKAVLSKTLLNESSNPLTATQSRTVADRVADTQLATHLDSWVDAAEELKAKIDEAVAYLESQRDADHSGERMCLLNKLSSICHAVQRERKSSCDQNMAQENEDELSDALVAQLALSQCSTITSTTAKSLKSLVQLKSHLTRASPSRPLHPQWDEGGVSAMMYNEADDFL
ncbi:COP9 signalosome complex subunit 6-like [Condylostylus longicornis]|uniref:COP9 signalosome complex subunit 6-like n=1 Tax=Condylostylus longicornis TaxID=2530218 RepID=UPI00244E35FC|nr:COP9 signalosome complex subunit 6-like [Condylostylus longicornis]